MVGPMEYAAAFAEQASDMAKAAFAAIWPRSSEAREIERLARDGCPAGTVCDVEFSLSFDGPTMTAAGLGSVRTAGFAVTDESSISRGFVVVRLPLRLSPWDLARTTARLNRLIDSYGGYAVFIGAVELSSAATMSTPPVEPEPGPSRHWYRAAS